MPSDSKEDNDEQLIVRLPTRVKIALMRRADLRDRKLSDYVRFVLENYCFGHDRSVDEVDEQRPVGHALQNGPRKVA